MYPPGGGGDGAILPALKDALKAMLNISGERRRLPRPWHVDGQASCSMRASAALGIAADADCGGTRLLAAGCVQPTTPRHGILTSLHSGSSTSTEDERRHEGVAQVGFARSQAEQAVCLTSFVLFGPLPALLP